MTRVGASARYFFPDEYYTTLSTRLASNLLVSEVEDCDGRKVASALFMRHDSSMHYHLSGATNDAARQGATNLVVWQAAQWGLHSGASSLHLGGGVQRDDSLFKFKRSFGGKLLAFSTYGLIVDPEAFAKAVRDAGMEPNSDHSDQHFFPPFRTSRD
jgi:lipid II:glycine glycyltransferase (peptidoglycan interpeptide bridge formation enzyme)